MKKEDVYVVGIAGGSASGKTTIIEKLKKQFKDEIVMISHDFYYWPNDDKTLEERAKLNYDHPKSFETSKLIEDVKILKSKDLSLYTVINTGTGSDPLSLVLSLKALVNSGILIPTPANAGPGFAWPAGNCNLAFFTISLAISKFLSSFVVLLNYFSHLL